MAATYTSSQIQICSMAKLIPWNLVNLNHHWRVVSVVSFLISGQVVQIFKWETWISNLEWTLLFIPTVCHYKLEDDKIAFIELSCQTAYLVWSLLILMYTICDFLKQRFFDCCWESWQPSKSNKIKQVDKTWTIMNLCKIVLLLI